MNLSQRTEFLQVTTLLFSFFIFLFFFSLGSPFK